MNTFERAWEFVLKNEGNEANNENDRGGVTKYGISLRFLKGLTIEEGDVNEDGKIDSDDIKDLTLEKAKEMYEVHYWLSASCDKIKQPRVAIKLFDMAVNFGVSSAVKMLQDAVGATQDGINGPKTLQLVNKANESMLLMKLIMKSDARYRAIVEKNPSQGVFLKGWRKRAKRIPLH